MTGEQLKELRLSRKQSRQELARELEVSEFTVAKWEQGVNPIPYAYALLILGSAKLKVDLETIQGISSHVSETQLTHDEALADLIRLGIEFKKAQGRRPKKK